MYALRRCVGVILGRLSVDIRTEKERSRFMWSNTRYRSWRVRSQTHLRINVKMRGGRLLKVADAEKIREDILRFHLRPKAYTETSLV